MDDAAFMLLFLVLLGCVIYGIVGFGRKSVAEIQRETRGTSGHCGRCGAPIRDIQLWSQLGPFQEVTPVCCRCFQWFSIRSETSMM